MISCSCTCILCNGNLFIESLKSISFQSFLFTLEPPDFELHTTYSEPSAAGNVHFLQVLAFYTDQLYITDPHNFEVIYTNRVISGHMFDNNRAYRGNDVAQPNNMYS